MARRRATEPPIMRRNLRARNCHEPWTARSRHSDAPALRCPGPPVRWLGRRSDLLCPGPAATENVPPVWRAATPAERSTSRSLVGTETLAFLFTDVEGSTALLQRVGDEVYSGLLVAHHEIIRSGLAAYGGREVNTAGDGLFAVFSSPRACVAAVVEMQRSLAAHEWPAATEVRVRMGIHVGEAVDTPTGLVGFDVHRAARVAAIGHGGQVLVSEVAAALLRHSLPADVALRDLGSHRLKDLGAPEHIFQVEAPGLDVGFPPLRSLDNPLLLNNLPAQPSSFIGRSQELSELKALVGRARLVTLTGAGGSGKTRLALQVAADLLDGSGDGAWLVELAAITDGQAVPQAIARALGIVSQPSRPALEALLDALSVQRPLVILDNCEHLVGTCATVAAAILGRCAGVHVLATSREPLGVSGENIYRVPSMSLPGPRTFPFLVALTLLPSSWTAPAPRAST